MATQRKDSRSQVGSTLYGVLAGLLIGLTIAAAVAFYVTRAPMPFIDKASRQAGQSKMPDLSQVNPNQGLAGGTVTVPPVPGPSDEEDAARKSDDLGALIASLSDDKKPADSGSSASASTPVPVPAAPATSSASSAPVSPSAPAVSVPVPAAPPAPVPAAKPASAAPAPAPAASTATPSAPRTAPAAASSEAYFLQAGAYKQSVDAESIRARILLLGLNASVQRAEVNGAQLYRVRLGPFAKLDDMNRARVRLSESKIESTIVRQ